ncbi:PAAR-like protein [Chryseobacterium sp.]|uniref:glycoside hydrolase family protein n=1 Tax=Chryseobacterium sp. TaxID=1871047 RepID=UPI003341D08E
MSAPIPYTVQSGETLQDIAQKLGIKDWTKLKEYHNAHSATQVGNTPYTGFSLMTPPPDEVYQLNGETPPPDPAEEQKTAEQKQEEEKKQEEEEKKNEKASKSEHYGKYLVVHGAKCVCDKAENPAQTADLQVTTHSIIILNDAQGKLAATEEDKTFNPPAATFGKCKLKPSSGGYLPCTVAPAPKWGKTYDSTQVMGKNTLTEISELQCTVGGKITISKHGQTDSVSNAHAENTNPVALGMVNPAIEQPKKKEEYPSVTSIVLTQIENRITFKEIDSKNKSGVVYLRKDEEASFKANLKSGNKQLTSWMIYSDHQGKKENRIFLREQIGTEFSQSLEGYGKFRIEGYGKPKTPEFEKGKYDKCDPSCSIDVEVIENTLLDLESASGDFTTRIDPSKNRKFRRGVPSVFKAKFFIPDLTEEEKSRLTLTVLDASGNAITEGVHVSGDTLTFTPQNTKAKYTVLARYINENGEAIEKKMSGESEGNAVLGISHGAEIVRPGTSMSFSVSKMKYNFGDDNSPFGITPDESSEIKWNLDGVLIGNGKSITIPGARVTPGKHVVEAYSMVANATGKNAKKEDDDWHFEVKENDVVSFSINGTPKVGKPLTATVDKMIFPDLLPGETIYWQGFSNAVTGKSVTFTPKTPGTLTITSKIKGKGSTQKITVVQPAINDIQFTDNNGNKIEKAGWGQKINIWIDQKGLDNEKLTIVLWDSDTIQDDPVKTITVNAYDGGLIPVTLDADMRNKTGDQGSIYVKISAPELVATGEGQVFPKTYKLNVQDKKEIFNAKLGSEDGKEKHTVVDYDEVSFFYANSRGITPKEDLYLEIRDSVLGRDPLLLHQANVKADQNGVIKQKIIWNNIKNKVNLLTVYAIIKEKDKDGKVLYDADGDYSMATAKLKKGSTLVKLVENKGAVKVGDQPIGGGTNCGGKFCIKKGSPKSELIREINIRLAGFGGNVPTDEFTDNTEKMVKQFQRDYMKVPETGKVCGNVLKAIDEFCNKYIEQINDYKCPCQNPNNSKENDKAPKANRCPEGWGKGLYANQYMDSKIKEQYRKYEYPGMHRSILWAVSAMNFYLDYTKSKYKKFDINRGYRCWADNDFHKRKSTNHLGKAADIRFTKNGIRTKEASDANTIRSEIFNKYLNAKWWGNPNFFTLEKESDGAVTYVHVDCRDFTIEFHDNKFFVKTQELVMGKSIVQIANELGLKDMCSCMGGGASTSNSNPPISGNRVDPKTLKTSQKGKDFIKDWEKYYKMPYDDSEHYATIGYGYLIAYKSYVNVTKTDVEKTDITWKEFKEGISEERALQLFEEKIKKYENSVYRDVTVKLYQHEFDALVSLLFNCGPDFLKNNKAPKLYRNLLGEKYEDAAKEFLDITNDDTEGLVKRRKAENDMFLNNHYDSTH